MSVVLNNYFKLGEQFDGDLKTRDLKGAYWISPKGEFFHIAVDGTVEIGRPSSLLKLKPCKELNEMEVALLNCQEAFETSELRVHALEGLVHSLKAEQEKDAP